MAAFVTGRGGGNDPDIEQIAQSNPELSILVEAVSAAGLVDTLKGRGPFTVLAPTNAAFASELSQLGVRKAILLADKTLLTKVLKADIPVGSPVTTAQGDTLSINATFAITDPHGRSANIVNTDVLTSSGFVYNIRVYQRDKVPPRIYIRPQ